MERRTYNPSEPLTFPGMSQMVRAGNTLYLSGQCAMDENAQLVGEGDALAQARQCFANISELLASEGATLADIVKLNCFVTSTEPYKAYSQVKRELFLSDPPTGTTVVVVALLDPRFLMEVEAIAVLGD